jgi:hypothetical protein
MFYARIMQAILLFWIIHGIEILRISLDTLPLPFLNCAAATL